MHVNIGSVVCNLGTYTELHAYLINGDNIIILY